MDRKLSVDTLLQELSMRKYKELHVHHTYRPNHSNFTGKNHQSIQDGMRNFHKNTRGWRDIGQHITLFPDGVILTGRDFDDSPASITGRNTGAFAVEMVGDFDKGKDKLEGAQLDTILQIAKYFIDTYGEGSIVFHREYAGKTCPGSGIDKKELIEKAKAFGSDSIEIVIDGKKVKLPSVLVDGKSYAHIRPFALALGAKSVDYINKVVVIKTK